MASLAELKAREERAKERLENAKRKRKNKESRDKAAERKRDTRRKILIGALILSEIQVGRTDEKELLKRLDAYLEEPRDRVLFALDETIENGDNHV